MRFLNAILLVIMGGLLSQAREVPDGKVEEFPGMENATSTMTGNSEGFCTAVEGWAACDGDPLKGNLMQLWDEDDLSPDDLLDEKKADGEGHVFLHGCDPSDPGSSIEPYVYFHHTCHASGSCPHCVFRAKVPDSHICAGDCPPEKVWRVRFTLGDCHCLNSDDRVPEGRYENIE